MVSFICVRNKRLLSLAKFCRQTFATFIRASFGALKAIFLAANEMFIPVTAPRVFYHLICAETGHFNNVRCNNRCSERANISITFIISCGIILAIMNDIGDSYGDNTDLVAIIHLLAANRLLIGSNTLV